MRKALTVAAVMIGLALGLGTPDPGWAQKGPIKVALLVPETGPLSANGKDMINGLQLFFEEQGWRLAGREIKLTVEDDEGKPASGLTKARGLVEGQGIHILIGPLSAAVGYAIAPYVDGKKVPTIFPIVSAEDITQRKRSPYIVRTGWSSSQPSHPFGKWVYDTLGYRKIAMIGYDFAFGWEVAAGFHRAFEETGGQIVQKLWPPLNTPDFAPYLAQLRRDVDAVYAVFSGADALRFSKQYAEAGLKGRLPLIGGGTFTDEHVLRVMGDEVLGVVTALHYSAAL
ncbi:MAG TPA: ABC transporter substrate-binding protein, partial [Methylomirabilota bacterium]|nr:ABC transporter substrate-binding protein [Methylomirabilota bacterium]